MRKSETKILPDVPDLGQVSSLDQVVSRLLSPVVNASKRRKPAGKAQVVQSTRQLRRQEERLRRKQAQTLSRAGK